MIGQYLSNKNENDTVAKSEFFSELNKALVSKHLFQHSTEVTPKIFLLSNYKQGLKGSKII